MAEFDYVIVGAGSAGCVLAARLAEDPGLTVCVLEAGPGDWHPMIHIPAGWMKLMKNPRYNWMYEADASEWTGGRTIPVPRGKTVGGSSSINGNIFNRGAPSDFDHWAQRGNPGWGYGDLLPLFRRMESWLGPDDAGYRGTGGPLRITPSPWTHPLCDAFLAGAETLGIPRNPDYNGARQFGAAYSQRTIVGGRRQSAAQAFLRPALKRGNVKVLKHAQVERLLIQDGRATGVRYRIGDETKTVHAKGEVIVSAGAVNTPQILQLSGIGPAGLLGEHGIAVAQDLAQVGRGMQDHLAVTHHFGANERTLNNRLSHPFGQFLAGMQYVLTRKGPISVPVNQVGGFIRSDNARPVSDMQVFCNPASYSIEGDGKPRMDREPGFILSVQPCRPQSRGTVSIASDDPRDAPLIQPNSLSEDADCAAAVRASKLLRSLANAPTIQRVTRMARTPDISRMDDAEMLENFRARASTVFHPSCTCRMGRDASDSVLDARLRVHGVAGLRVVDASAFPNITSGNINAPTMMLAMRAADLILEDAPAGAVRNREQ